MNKNLFFTVLTPLSCTIRVTVAYWEIITQIKHPILKLKKEKSYGRSKRLLRSDGKYPNRLVWRSLLRISL